MNVEPPHSPLTPQATTSQQERHRAAKRRRGIVLLVLGVALLTIAGVALWAALKSSPPADSATESSEQTPAQPDSPEAEVEVVPEKPEAIRISAMGDMLPHDSINLNAETSDGSWDYGQFFTGIMPQLETADAIFCNQEVPSAGEEFGITGYPVFNAPHKFAEDLSNEVGCDLVNLANNHAADLGAPGIAATRGLWDNLDLLSISGANRTVDEQNTIMYGEVGGVTTALVSFAEYSNIAIDDVSLNLMGDTELVQRLMNEARANAQLVLVSAHWGTEDSHTVNGQQRGFAQTVADLGADVVLGTGPHVLQEVDWLDRADGGKTLVWYSLGNMLNTQLSLPQLTGIVASFEIMPAENDGPATVQNPTAVLTYMHYDWTDEEAAAGDLLARNNLSIQPVTASDELLARTSFGVTAAELATEQAQILGPHVTVLDE